MRIDRFPFPIDLGALRTNRNRSRPTAPQSRVGLHAGQRQRVHHLDVPPELQNMSLVQIHASGRVEIKDKQPKLVKKIVSGARRKTRSKK
jgi:hypothetical protein